MMKKILLIVCMLIPMVAAAQMNDPVENNDSIVSIVEKVLDKRIKKSRLNIDFCTSMNGYFTDGEFDEVSLKVNRVRFDWRGSISDQFSYRIRQSFNKSFSKASTDNIPPALEYANLQWHPNDRFNLVIGRQFLVIGGYEALANSMYVREFCDFNDNLAFYRAGITGEIKLDEKKNHTLQLQITNNRSGKDSDIYPYGLPEGVRPTKVPFMYAAAWNGYFADKSVNLIYAASVAPIAENRNMYYLSCGNIYEKGPVFAYFDVMYSHESVDTQQRLTGLLGDSQPQKTIENVEYLSFIARFDYKFHPKWNAYVKGAYETSSIYAANNGLASGRYMANWNAQASVEWHPLGRSKGLRLFAHYLYKGYELYENAQNVMLPKPDIQRVSVGILYVIPVL